MPVIRPNADPSPLHPKASADECCMERPYPLDKAYCRETNHVANVQYGQGNAGYDADHDCKGVPIKHGNPVSPNQFFGIKNK